MDKKKVLLIDDDEEFLQATKQLLETSNYEVYIANTGQRGIEEAKKCNPDLIILDVMMASETEGFEINRQMQTIPALKDVPIVMLTGINAKGDQSYRYDTEKGWPCSALLDKPVLPEKLLSKIRELVS